VTDTVEAALEKSIPEKPLPTIDAENEPFWVGTAQGVLRMQKCDSCGHIRFPIQALCPVCISPAFHWSDLSGRGTIFAKIVYHQAFHPSYRADVPYNLVIVQLDEGPRMFSNVLEAASPSVIGDRVEVVFDQASDAIFIPRFRPATS
jgi:uncharacterized OB-fold protein